MADAEILLQALKDHFANAEPQEITAESTVIKKPGAPTLIKDAQGNWQAMEPPHPEFMDTPRLPHEQQETIKADAEQRQKKRIAEAKRIARQIESDHYRVLCESQQAPVGSTGRSAISFLAELKNVFAPPINGCLEKHPEFLSMSMEERVVFLKASPEYVDWKLTYGLRLKILEGFENQKSARPGRQLGPVSDQDILKAAEDAVNPPEPKIVGNRFVRS